MSEGLGGGATETAAAAVPFDPPGALRRAVSRRPRPNDEADR